MLIFVGGSEYSFMDELNAMLSLGCWPSCGEQKFGGVGSNGTYPGGFSGGTKP